MSTKPNGVHFLEREEYDRLPRVNWSTLKWISTSPAHYQQVLLAATEDTDAMKLGRACHIAVFEPDQFKARCLMWDGGARRGKDWEKFVADHPQDEILTEHQYETAMAVGRAVRTSQMAQQYVSGGQGEVTVLWEHVAGAIKVPCKSRLDFVTEGAIVDLKTVNRIGGASPENFPWTCKNLRYWTQAAFYRRAYQFATGRLLPCFLVAVETMAPYATQTYRLKESDMADGEQEYQQLLEIYADCRQHNRWPQYATEALSLERPGTGEDDLASELGLTPSIGFGDLT